MIYEQYLLRTDNIEKDPTDIILMLENLLWCSLCTLYLLECQMELPQASQISSVASFVYRELSFPSVYWLLVLLLLFQASDD